MLTFSNSANNVLSWKNSESNYFWFLGRCPHLWNIATEISWITNRKVAQYLAGLSRWKRITFWAIRDKIMKSAQSIEWCLVDFSISFSFTFKLLLCLSLNFCSLDQVGHRAKEKDIWILSKFQPHDNISKKFMYGSFSQCFLIHDKDYPLGARITLSNQIKLQTTKVNKAIDMPWNQTKMTIHCKGFLGKQ